MILWRISNDADLSGAGGMLHRGRRHHRGRPVVYLAESAAGALLEVLVHVEAAQPSELPRDYQLLEVELPDDAPMEDVQLPAGDDWRRDLTLTRGLGDQWLLATRSLLLRVPSVVVGRTANRLFNPLHPAAAACRILSAQRYPFDDRLF